MYYVLFRRRSHVKSRTTKFVDHFKLCIYRRCKHAKIHFKALPIWVKLRWWLIKKWSLSSMYIVYRSRTHPVFQTLRNINISFQRNFKTAVENGSDEINKYIWEIRLINVRHFNTDRLANSRFTVTNYGVNFYGIPGYWHIRPWMKESENVKITNRQSTSTKTRILRYYI